MTSVRVRYAPSPTGHLHVGSLRTALYNWLFARHHGGEFLIRIEDTDLERSQVAYTESILASLDWASLTPDEPVMIQSERKEIHKKIAEELVAQGKAYRCFCTPDELLQRLGESAAHEGGYVQYDQKCRSLKGTEQDLAQPSAIRFKMPEDREYIEFKDLIHGVIRFERDQFDDFIIVRSDGTPMYNFVVVVDDAAMKISHVLRGEDHISNTPKQIVLYEACGYPIPEFAHFSLILGPDGRRLSKRHGATSVLDYKQEGFLAQALCNYLVRLGWSHGDQEIFTREELIQYFSLEHMSKTGAIFDQTKLEWVNGVHIRELTPEELVDTLVKDVDPQCTTYFSNWSMSTLHAAVALYQDRAKTLKELIDEVRALHDRPQEFTQDLTAFKEPIVIVLLTAVYDRLLALSDHSHDAINSLIKEVCSEFKVPFVRLGQPLRIALTGKISSPGVAHLIALLGIEESTERILFFMNCLKKE